MYAKPPPGSRPRSSHPHALGLRHCFLFNEGSGFNTRDCVGGLNLELSGANPTWARNAWGPSIKFTGVGGGLKYVATGGAMWGRWVNFIRGVETAYSIVVGVQQVSGSQGSYHALWANGSSGFYIQTGRPQWYPAAQAKQTITAGENHVVSAAAVSDNSGITGATGEIEYNIDGRFDSVTNYVTWEAGRWPVGNFVCGNDAASDVMTGQISFLYLYDRFIGDGSQSGASYNASPVGVRGEMSWLHAEPFEMFRKEQKFWVMAGIAAQTVNSSGSETFQHPLLAGTGSSYSYGASVGAETFRHPLLSGAASFTSASGGVGSETIAHPLLSGTGIAYEFTQLIVTQTPVEWVGETSPNLVVTQVPTEWVGETDPNAVVTQVPVEWTGTKSVVKLVVTQVAVEAVFGFVQCAAEIPPLAGGGGPSFDFDECEDWPSQDIVPGTDPLVA